MTPRLAGLFTAAVVTLIAPAPSQAASPPSFGTVHVVERHATSLSIEVPINPNGAATTAHMEFGRTTALGGSSDPLSIKPGSEPVPATVNLTGLARGTTYYFRFTATNEAGTTITETASASTSPRPVLRPPSIAFAFSTGPSGSAPWRILAVSRPRYLPTGTRVSVHCRSACTGGRSFVLTHDRSRQARFAPPIRITAKSVVEVRARKRGYIGRVLRYRFERSGALIVATRIYNRCLSAGKPVACPKRR